MTQTSSESPLSSVNSSVSKADAAHGTIDKAAEPNRPFSLASAFELPPLEPTEPDSEAKLIMRPRRGGWRNISVRTKATALAIVISTIPMLVIGGAAYTVANRSVTRQIESSEKSRVVGLQDKVNRFMFERFGDIQVLSQLDILTNPQLRASITTEDKAATLTRFMNSYGMYDSIAVTDLKGNVIVQTKSNPLGNLLNRPYMQAALKANGPVLSQPAISLDTGNSSLFAAAVIKDQVTGEPIGLVRSRMPVKAIYELIKNDAAEGTQYYLVDGTNKIFVGPEGVYVGSTLATGAAATNRQDQYKGVSPETLYPNIKSLEETNQIGAIRSMNTKDNTEHLLAYAPPVHLQGLPDLGWQAIVSTDTAVAFAPQRELLLTLTLGIGLAALAMAAITADIANRATRPVRSAASAVKKIGQGNLETRLQVEGEDELGVLGLNINNMASQLQKSLAAQTLETEQERLITAAKGSGVLHPADLQAIFEQAVRGSRQLFNLDRVVVYRFDTGSGGGIIAESVAGDWSRVLENNVSDSCIPESVRQAYREGRVVVTTDVFKAGFSPEHLQLLDRLQVKASLITPILQGTSLYGLLVAHVCAAPYEWQPSEVNFFQRLGNELGLTMYRIELLEQTTLLAAEQRRLKENLQKRALELLMEVDPISQGDLTTRAKVTADEIGTIADSYNATIDNLRRIVLQVQDAANQVVATTNVNETSIATLSIEALRQAEEIAAALELVRQMADAVQTVAANAGQAEAAVQKSAQTVAEGDEVMNRTVIGIQVIRSTVADTAKKVKHLGESSQKISKVVELISAFAAQTNMLALNASIEASRAGEEGRGFGVVANEVRTLARQSAEATEEIRGLVASIQAETNEVVSAMESGIEQVVTGTKLVDETRQSLNKITAASLQISELVEAIAQSTIVQSQASETVTETMKGVAAIANKTSTEVGQVSSSFDQLRKVAQALQAGVGQFKV